MADVTMRIAYDGEALRNGTMDVRDLAPALLALSDLLDEANSVLNGKDRAIELRVHAIRKGSFDIGLHVFETFATKVVNLFSGDAASGLANLLEILGFTTGYGLLKLVKWVRGRPVKRVELLNDGRTRLIVEGDEIVITRNLAALFNDVAVRRALAKILDPLRRPGVDEFEVRDAAGAVVEHVDKADVPYFDAPEPSGAPAQTIRSEFEQAFTIVSVTFREGNKWRVYDGQNTTGVTIADGDFLARVNNREVSFAKDDTIVCNVLQEQTIGPDGLKTETTVTKVLDHRHAPRQTVLQFVEPPSEPPDDTA